MTTRDKKEFLDLATDFDGFVKQHGWVSRYDTESDSFSITTPKLSNSARIKYFDDEVAFYINKENRVEGIFLEYFKSNFMKHHKNAAKELEKVLEKLEENNKDDNTTVKVDIKKVKKITPDLQEAIKTSLAGRLDLSPC
jgi:hypothetical protein